MSRIIVAIGVFGSLLAATAAFAHGPSVRLSYDRVTPPKITIYAGQTIHFQNTSLTPRTLTVKAEDGSFESPPMGRGEGWHHTFEAPGSFPFAIVEFPSTKGAVVVAPKASD